MAQQRELDLGARVEMDSSQSIEKVAQYPTFTYSFAETIMVLRAFSHLCLELILKLLEF